MDDPIFGLMAPETKNWFARAIVGMMWADGRIDQAEIDYLKGLLGFLKLTMGSLPKKRHWKLKGALTVPHRHVSPDARSISIFPDS